MGVIVGYIVFFAICLGFIMGYGFKAIIDDSKKEKGDRNKSGKWTLMYEPKNMVVCSECGKCAYMYQDKTSAFCPHCGAKMQESEDKE